MVPSFPVKLENKIEKDEQSNQNLKVFEGSDK